MEELGMALGFMGTSAHEDTRGAAKYSHLPEKFKAGARETIKLFMETLEVADPEDLTPERLDAVWEYFQEHLLGRFINMVRSCADGVSALFLDAWLSTQPQRDE